MTLIKKIKLVDKIFGPFLRAVFPKATAIQKERKVISRILVIRPGGMGDALLLLPALKKTYDSRKVVIDVLCEPRNKSVFDVCLFINDIYSYQQPLSFLSVFINKYDAVIDTEQSYLLSAIIARLIQAPIKIGFNTFERGKFFTQIEEYQTGYEAENFWRLFSILFKFKESFAFKFPYLKASKKKKRLYADIKNPICLFPGATTPQRHWPENRWAGVCDWITAKGYTPILLGGSMEVQSCQKILEFCRTENVINLCDHLSIEQTVHLFTKAQLLISTDSGILHLGVICNLPTISIFGPSSPQKWGPKGLYDKIVNKQTDCSPCASFGNIPECKQRNACMLDIEVADVLQVLEEWDNQVN